MGKLRVLEWECSKCGKKIRSIYPKQFYYNKKQHVYSHKKDKGV